ncbi:hypothetical protein C8R48DRAFT_675409 [Suillus tomentosus]|nr:hypothetical protein C8R48DRAFT_675409 [Suillus tomentosus]
MSIHVLHVFSLPEQFGRLYDAYLQYFQQIRCLLIATKGRTIDFIKSYDPWNCKTLESILIVIILVLLFVIHLWSTSPSCLLTKDSKRARTALQALQTVIVPSCSLWPARYIKLAKHVSNHRTGSRIVVPLGMLLKDVYDGVIELRDPLYDLEDLIDQGVLTRRRLSIRDLDGLTDPLATAPPPSTDYGTIIDLNNHPLTHVATIHLPQGSPTTLEFTSLSNHIPFLSTKHIFCVIPFLAHRLPHRLSDVLATINDTPQFKLSTLTNTSAVYADALAALSTKITYDPVARQQCVDALSVKEWRKRRLMLEFEAALVLRGWLERWNVVLEARTNLAQNCTVTLLDINNNIIGQQQINVSKMICDVEEFRNTMMFGPRVYVTTRADRGVRSICTKVGMAVSAAPSGINGLKKCRGGCMFEIHRTWTHKYPVKIKAALSRGLEEREFRWGGKGHVKHAQTKAGERQYFKRQPSHVTNDPEWTL